MPNLKNGNNHPAKEEIKHILQTDERKALIKVKVQLDIYSLTDKDKCKLSER